MALAMSMGDSQLQPEPAAVDRQPPAGKGPSSLAATDEQREVAGAGAVQVVPQRVCMAVPPDDVACSWSARMGGGDAEVLDPVRRPQRKSRLRRQQAWPQSQTRATLQAAVWPCASREAAESPGASSSLLLSRSCTPSAWLPPQKRQAAGPSRLCKLCQVLPLPLGPLRCPGRSSLAAFEGVTS